MKRTVSVTFTKELEIDIPDEFLTNEAITKFHAGMFETNSEDDFFKYAAGQIAQYGTCFIEGLGQAVPKHLKKFAGVVDPITFGELNSYFEMEIM